MTGRLSGRTCLITGSSSGLGRAIALRFASEGANIICSDLSPTARALLPGEDAHPTHELVQRHGGNATFIKCDISEPEDVKAAVVTAVKEFGRLDVLVNNAGISFEARRGFRQMHETDLHEFDETLRVNVRGVFLGCKYAVEQMLKQPPKFGSDRGWIINIASVLSFGGMPGSISYVASKGAVMQMTKTIALEYAAKGIHCNAICPGFTMTTLLGPLLEEGGKSQLEEISAKHPLGGIGKPEDIAKAAVFLASDDAAWVTGIPLPVDGGYLAR
ncbi:uncharacterized protein Z520_00181 [Fonsecaea multimorphosa CBS 102226]|uniref:Uncharacterized protein n=1 Tax=Fonsecaea multimorphosa CBS 102226 TaxID=1442371 RepID=A0A0D2KJ41_9EURO|nr:uncharacterized protein Z520_00181 [Fonsecaea multimorphosa CBS 102226]KIY03490.1 hypothetical protein Z520_00181 [Fonsecaea multimorphosa CBS 102226]OAL32747.1 hypothetical protein AYO22_00221 [Fonsecaea multimorphosa]